jgi:hypothetical protein
MNVVAGRAKRENERKKMPRVGERLINIRFSHKLSRALNNGIF